MGNRSVYGGAVILGQNEAGQEEEYVYPGWLYDLPVVQGVKTRALSGYPTFYPIDDTIAASSSQEYEIEVTENEIWVVQSYNHGDILPDLFYVTISFDDQPVVPRQLLTMNVMDIEFPHLFPITGRVYIKVENTATYALTYQAVLWYETFVRGTLNRLLAHIGIPKL